MSIGRLFLTQNNIPIIIQQSKVIDIIPSKINGYILIKCTDENFILRGLLNDIKAHVKADSRTS